MSAVITIASDGHSAEHDVTPAISAATDPSSLVFTIAWSGSGYLAAGQCLESRGGRYHGAGRRGSQTGRAARLVPLYTYSRPLPHCPGIKLLAAAGPAVVAQGAEAAAGSTYGN